MITEQEYLEAQKVVDAYRKQQFERTNQELSNEELKQKEVSLREIFPRYKKKGLTKWYQKAKKDLGEVLQEIESRK